MSVIEGLSHIVLATSSIEKYESCIQFYSQFGFETVVNSKIATSEPSKYLTQEKWLHLFGKPPVHDITLKLVLVANAIKKVPTSEEKDWRLEQVSVASVTKDIVAVESILKSINAKYQKYAYSDVNETDLLATTTPANLVHTEIYTHDPLDNLIVFTNKPNPFSKSIYPIKPKSPVKKEIIESGLKILPQGTKMRIGVLTSGGDSPGMNAAVRSIVRVAISRGCEAYAIFEGYKGLVNGGDMIKKFGWGDVRGYLAIGGTLIGTARCAAFRERKGRLSSAYNLIKNKINSLIVCGGDGSLTGANALREEWPGLLSELIEEGRITAEEAEPYKHLIIVGLVGSIDNDMSSTDITIGATTSLHRICEAVDSISSTALSHSRAFVIEVMGRHCGWLALMAAVSCGADFVFIPERPPTRDDWESDMCEVLERHRRLGKRKTIVIVAEGAIDKNLKPIKPEYIKELLTNRMGLDTRVTTLGHTQRGGRPCTFDRNLATIQGVEAVEAVLRSTPDTPSPMIGVRQNKITCEPLMLAVEKTNKIAEAIAQKDFRLAMDLRDPEFTEDYQAYVTTTIVDNQPLVLPEQQRIRIGICHIGAPAGGMNPATRAAVRYALNRGHTPIAIYNGFAGLLQDNLRELSWLDVDGWASKGGSELGTNRIEPNIDIGMVAYQFQKHKIHGLLLIGGFEAYTSLLRLNEARKQYPAFCIPMICLPATISNNVPGTDFSLGSDTSLNAIVDSCDAIKQSASASRRRVFVVEVHGGQCGYLAVMSGLAVGATSAYIPEDGISLKTLQADVNHLIRRFGEDKKGSSSGRLILRNECVSKTYTTDVIASIFKSESCGLFDSRTSILGHVQQGGSPSPTDRIRATKLAVKCVKFLEEFTSPFESEKIVYPSIYTNVKESVAVIGIDGAQVKYTVDNFQIPAVDLLAETDIENRKSRKAWWIHLKGLVELLSKWGKVNYDFLSLFSLDEI
ncbi:293_t:CDS:10 [Funneliformis caledonium]|uniref:ATP-dependent 6-phosphofructokinase n=1 Tax=Funneliformis caledonium TaxID=1117310 RepID=A0A9N8VRE3_9GLOM|nr:293_t:CDS:10 [Funneliformis caledonium]